MTKRRTKTDGARGYQPNVMYCANEPMRCADCGDAIEPGDGYFTSIMDGKRTAYCTRSGVGRSWVEDGPEPSASLSTLVERYRPKEDDSASSFATVMFRSDEPMRCVDCGDAIEPGDGYFVMIWENKIGAYCTKYSEGLARVRGGCSTQGWDILKFADRAKPIA